MHDRGPPSVGNPNAIGLVPIAAAAPPGGATLGDAPTSEWRSIRLSHHLDIVRTASAHPDVADANKCDAVLMRTGHRHPSPMVHLNIPF